MVKKPCICKWFKNFNIDFLGRIKQEAISTAKDTKQKELYEMAIDCYIYDGVTMNVIEEYDASEIKSFLEKATKEECKGFFKYLDHARDNYRDLNYLLTSKRRYFPRKKYKELKKIYLR